MPLVNNDPTQAHRTESNRLTFRAMREIESGLIYFNAPTTGAEIHLPFGGMKQSGNGHRELGSSSVDEFSEVKSIFVSYPTYESSRIFEERF